MTFNTPRLFSALILSVLFVALAARAQAATLDVTGGSLTYTPSTAASNVTISVSGTFYEITDSAEIINLTGGALAAGWTGSGTNTAAGFVSSVTGGWNVTLNPAGTGSISINGNISGLGGLVSLGSGQNIIFNSGGGISTSGNVQLAAGGAIQMGSGVSISATSVTLSKGALTVNGTVTATTVTVDSGATLGGSGTINGNVVLQSGSTLDLRSGLTITGTITNNGATVIGGFTVTNLNDSGAGSLRQAIADANALLPGPNAIDFQVGLTGTITLTSGELLISSAVTIVGLGANVSVSGNNASRVFEIASGHVVAIVGLTITGGNFGLGNGGGIFNNGTLTLISSTISGNTARSGGGIHSNGALTLTSSTVSGNSATQGGGIFNNGTLMTLTSSTISGNSGSIVGGGIVDAIGSVNVVNTIIAGNTAGVIGEPDAVSLGGAFTDNGNNLIGDTFGSNGFTNATTLTGTVATPLNPLLAPLGNYGGPTQTMLLLPGSPAINTGSNAAAIGGTDQRSFTRIVGGTVDIGAVEFQGATLTATAGTPQSAFFSAAFATNLQVTATETGTANLLPNLGLTFTAPASGASGTFPGASLTAAVATNSSGIATAPAFTANSKPGSYFVTAAATPLASVAGVESGSALIPGFNLTNAVPPPPPSSALRLSSSANPSTLGQAVTFTAVINTSDGPPLSPTGTVQFFQGATLLGSGRVSGSQATFTTASLVPGNHFIEAQYSGDSIWPAAQASFIQSVNYAPISMNLTATPSAPVSGQAVTLTASVIATVPPGFAAPTGQVTFTDYDSIQLGTAALASGTATINGITLPSGPNYIQAQYSGDGTWPSILVQITVTVLPPISMNLTATPSAPVSGQAVTLAASIIATVPQGFAAPTGQVTFTESASMQQLLSGGGTSLGTAALASGTATINGITLPSGTNYIQARYSGDSTWPSISAQITVTVSGNSISSTNSAVSLTVASGELVLTGTVAPVAPASGTPTGGVQFVDASNSSLVATANLSGGTASATISQSAASLVAGRPIEAVYSGDANFKASTSAPLPAVENSAAGLTPNSAADELVSLFGITGLSGDTPAGATLTTSLGGATVNVADSSGTSRLALLYGVFRSAGQINLIVPSGTALGLATVTISTPGGGTLATVINVAETAAGIFTANMNGQGPYAGQVIYAHADGSQTQANAAILNSGGSAFVPNPISLSVAGDRVYLVLYGTGLRHAGLLTATVNGVSLPVSYFGAQGSSMGLDQINLGPLPASLSGAGTVNLVITADSQMANTVTLSFQ